MISTFKKILPDTHPLRLLYHRIAAFVAAIIYWFPADKMRIIAVTGTNGKTTTVNLICNILNQAGYKVGMSSSINYQAADERWGNISKISTAGPFKMQKLLKKMLRKGCEYVVLEVTSHAITQSRILGVAIDVAVITNVTPEHVDYHGSFDNYLNTKGQLFKKMSKDKRKFNVPKVSVLNADDEYFDFFDKYVVDSKITYGLKNATVSANAIVKSPEGSKFVLKVPNNSAEIDLQLPGEFNIYNAMAAAAACLALAIPVETIQAGLDASQTVPGRFEHVESGQDYSIIVDYAHTPEALESLLEMYRKLTTGKLFAVFGATGGGRDKSKRPVMGQIAEKHADYIIITDDDPYSEDEWEIAEQIAEGIVRKEGEDLWKIPDRKEAIRLALAMAQKGDTVVISGKGCEEIMKVRGTTIPWSDKAVVREILNSKLMIELSNEGVSSGG